MLDEAILFLQFEAGLLATLLAYFFYKSGFSIKKFKENWVISEGTKTPMWKAIAVILAVPVIFGLILYTANAKAEWFEGATAFAGIDRTYNPSPLCQSVGVDDNLTSNIGFTQNIYTKDVVNLGFKYTHHSCAVSPDKNSYDAAGIFVEWKIW